MLEIPAKGASIAPRQSSGVRESKIHDSERGDSSEAEFLGWRGIISELKRGFPVR
jgi:hypothetical protein